MDDAGKMKAVLDAPDAAGDQNSSQLSEHNDSRSSSLSELEYGPEDREDSVSRTEETRVGEEDDSEAETERLAPTPIGSSAARVSKDARDRVTSEKGEDEALADADHSSESSVALVGRTRTAAGAANGSSSAKEAGPASSKDASLEQQAGGRKRKRGGARESPIVREKGGEPIAKRSASARTNLLKGPSASPAPSGSDRFDTRNNVEESNEVEDMELQGGGNGHGAQEDSTADLATNNVSAKSKRPYRRGNNGRDGPNNKPDEQTDTAEVPEENGEGKADTLMEDEEEVSPADDEVLKKKIAMDALGAVESQFTTFRRKLCDEQIIQLTYELELLGQPNCVHPEYLAQISCIEERRDEQIRLEDALLQYKKAEMERRLKAEQSQIQCQYVKSVHDFAEKGFENCGKVLFKLQKARRQWGSGETENIGRYDPRRSEQVRIQTAYNKEVSLLSGIAKHVGFPAAPDLRGATPTELEADLRAMAPSTRTSLNKQHAEPAPIAIAAAEEQFFERTPWANPQHPAHQHSQLQQANQGRRHSSNLFTPSTAQSRPIDSSAPDGLAWSREPEMDTPLPARALPKHGDGSSTHRTASPPRGRFSLGAPPLEPKDGQPGPSDPRMGPSRPVARSDRPSIQSDRGLFSPSLHAHAPDSTPRRNIARLDESMPRNDHDVAAKSTSSRTTLADLRAIDPNRHQGTGDRGVSVEAKNEAREKMNRVVSALERGSTD